MSDERITIDPRVYGGIGYVPKADYAPYVMCICGHLHRHAPKGEQYLDWHNEGSSPPDWIALAEWVAMAGAFHPTTADEKWLNALLDLYAGNVVKAGLAIYNWLYPKMVTTELPYVRERPAAAPTWLRGYEVNKRSVQVGCYRSLKAATNQPPVMPTF